MSQSTLRQAAFVIFTVALAAGPMSSSETLAQTMRPSGPGQSVATAAPAPQGPTLSLTMEDAVKMALEANLGLAADRPGPEIQSQFLAAAKAFYNPLFTTSMSRFDSISAPNNPFDATATSVT